MKKFLGMSIPLLLTSIVMSQARSLSPSATTPNYGWTPWLILAGFILFTLIMVPRRVNARQFFGGNTKTGASPGLFLLVTSAVITWIFGKSIANASNLAATYGISGGIGYALYYLSFIVAGITLYFIRKKGGFTSVSLFIISKYGLWALRAFQYTIAFRLFNEVWSNTKVAALYFGGEGSLHFWICVAVLTGFTVYYSWKGGLRSSLLTDALQMVYMAILLGVILVLLGPGLSTKGLPQVDKPTLEGGLTFCLLALVQIFSYPFHDPVLTDRAFITKPRTMLRGFILAGIVSGLFIFLLSLVKGVGRLSFHLAFWPGILIGVLSAIHGFFHADFLPKSLQLGSGAFALDLRLNVYGLLICTIGFLIGVFITRRRMTILQYQNKSSKLELNLNF